MNNSKNILVIGLGLIGGSLAKLLKEKINCQILAFDLDQESLEEALSSKVIDMITNFEKIYNDKINIDLVIIATPLSTYQEIFNKINNFINDDAKIIDLGSVKNFKFKNTPKNFTACHPIAGSEKSGYENSDAKIFENCKIIICCEQSNFDPYLQELFDKIGFKIEFISAQKHDEIYALISHLPQFLSFLLLDFSPKEIEKTYSAAFRLTNSNPKMWQDIFSYNQNYLEKYYNLFFENLSDNIDLIQNNEDLNFLLTKAQKLHNNFANFYNNDPLNYQFFDDNFELIFFRFLAIISYLEIDDIKKYQQYSGSGFRDFITILKIIEFDHAKITQLTSKNLKKIIKIFNEIS